MDPQGPFSGRIRFNPLDRPLGKPKYEINLSAYALLFSEMVQYCQNRSTTIQELQERLAELGRHVGERIVDLTVLRDRLTKREIRIVQVLMWIRKDLWRVLFGKDADNLEISNEDPDTYYLMDSDLLVIKFISLPRDKAGLNCASFVAGLLEAVLESMHFAAKVTATRHKGTTFIIKFNPDVISRDRALETK